MSSASHGTNASSALDAMLRRARQASAQLAVASTNDKNLALELMAQSLVDHRGDVLEANAQDVASAERQARQGKVKPSFVDRLRLDEARIEKVADALREVAGLDDPVGASDGEWLRGNGLRVSRRRIPLGVIGIIYEARPNVTADAAGLCLKSGNVCVLKGGSRALASNRAIVAALKHGLAASPIPEDAIQFLDTSDRSSIREMLTRDDLIDLVIPRGGEGLIRFVAENSRIPVIKHYKGVCHVYVHEDAEPDMAERIVVNAKVQRPSVCNAAETIVVHSALLDTLWPRLAQALVAEGVTLHADDRAIAALKRHPALPDGAAVVATEDDFHAEYLTLDVAVATVDDLDQAMRHIRTYGSDHTEAIITSNYRTAQRFVDGVQSSVVLVNASTRFADGGELGLGAEIGISTTRLHAYGPMGLRELTTTKFVVQGQGQIRGGS